MTEIVPPPSAPIAGVMVHARCPRREVYVADPDGLALIRGVGTVVAERRLGGHLITCDVEMGSGQVTRVLAGWVTNLPDGPSDNVLIGPWPARRLALVESDRSDLPC